MRYPDWLITASEVAASAGLLALFIAIVGIAHRLHRLQKASRSGAVFATVALGLVGVIATALGLTFMVMEVHNDHQSGGAAIGWAMMIGTPALILAGPVTFIAWIAALVSADRALAAAASENSPDPSPHRRNRFRNR